MKSVDIQGEVLDKVLSAMAGSEMLKELSKKTLGQITDRAKLFSFEPGETVVEQGQPSDSFFLIVDGVVSVLHEDSEGDLVELGQMRPASMLGDIGLLLNHPRTATVQAADAALLLKFDRQYFSWMFENVKGFGLAVSKFLASRVQALSSRISLPLLPRDAPHPEPEMIRKLPMEFISRHRVLPLSISDNTLKLGFALDPKPNVVEAIRRLLPGLELNMVHMDHDWFDEVLRSQGGAGGLTGEFEIVMTEDIPEDKAPALDAILRRLVAEGASDLHLAAGQPLRWRLDGDIQTIEDSKILGPREVHELLEPIMGQRAVEEYEKFLDTDFGYTIPGLARFRINMFNDESGVNAALRIIPSQIMTIEQLGLPPVVKTLCEMRNGLVLVVGPTGSGKSTTLASMVDYINRTRRAHIITMEDPIEFIHPSQAALVHQREIGRHATDYHRALRAVLREDPDIVMVAEMRDLETIALALETASTGHLVFGTMHTNSAIGTVNRIVEAFPVEQQNQVRSGLSESLKGVLAQNLLKRIGGGRVAAIEVLVVDQAVANLIREEKTVQITSIMQTQKAKGNRQMNEELTRLVKTRKVEFKEALTKTDNRDELARLLDRPLPRD
ncbi:MAG: PilT/PilU family type 4a pilus ATPase [Proteobacteria bacterium]|nr:PilT/PilU family type 4a pilus ATPase [Pseudomonadota bacterium]